MSSSIFRLTDGTETINLMTNEPDGFYLQEYAPILSGFKGGGVFQDSPLADNRRPVYTRRETVVQPIVLSAKALSHDNISRMLQDLVRLLDKAKDYWISDWQNEPVWLEARTSEETNLRYALVYMWRIEDYPAPYQQPFQQEGGTPVAQEMTLFLEHGQWLDTLPTVEGGVSSEIVGSKYYPDTNVLRTGSKQNVGVISVPSHANITDLPVGAGGMTIEYWQRFTGIGMTRYLISKNRSGNPSWEVFVDDNNVYCEAHQSGGGIFIRSDFAIGGSNNLPIEFYDTNWHHISFTMDATTRPRMWVDGTEVLPVSGLGPTGAYSGDDGAGIGLEFFNFNSSTTHSRHIGWIRVSNTMRYTSDFTPRDLCNPPGIDANTVVQYNLAEGSGTTLDNAEGTSALDATIDLDYAEWDVSDDCMITGVEPTTEEVFVANRFSLQEITNWHIGTAGANLIGGSWPATVFSGATDTYVGSTDGVFNSIVLDITSAATTTPSWQYWNGAWTAITLSNVLSPGAKLDQTGQVILSWKPPADWIAASPGGSLPSGYYVRQTASIGTIQHAGPNDPYTVTWPFIQIDGDQLPGDIPNLARMLLRPVGSDGTNNASGAADKIIYGTRSLERGQAFRSHINMSDVGNVSGIFIDAGAGTFTSDTQAPTGRLIAYTATTTITSVGGAFINGAISRDYAGRFRTFIRFSYDIGTANTLTWIFKVQYGSNGSFFDSRPVVIDDTYEGSTPLSNSYLLEFNPIHIRSDLLVGTTQEVGEIILYPGVYTDTGTASIRLHDIVLIPTDEFSGEVERSPQSANQANALSLIDLDGTNQKLYNRAVKRNVSNDRIEELWLSRGVLPPSLQANATQRVFFLQRSSAAANSLEQSLSWQTLGVQMGKVSRYLGFRGDR